MIGDVIRNAERVRKKNARKKGKTSVNEFLLNLRFKIYLMLNKTELNFAV